MPHFKKGSPQAKAYMARLRAMRGKGCGGGGKRKTRLTAREMKMLQGTGLFSIFTKPIKYGIKAPYKGIKKIIELIKKKKQAKKEAAEKEETRNMIEETKKAAEEARRIAEELQKKTNETKGSGIDAYTYAALRGGIATMDGSGDSQKVAFIPTAQNPKPRKLKKIISKYLDRNIGADFDDDDIAWGRTEYDGQKIRYLDMGKYILDDEDVDKLSEKLAPVGFQMQIIGS